MTDGLLHVETMGEGDPVLLVHGFGASSFTWRFWTEELARERTAHLVDLKGFGKAPKPLDRAYSPVDQAGLLARYIVSEELTDVTLVGHSLGAGVVMLTALRLADEGAANRLHRLVIVSGAVYRQGIPFFISLCRIPLVAHLAFALTPLRFLIRKVLEEAYAPGAFVAEEAVDGYVEPLREAACRHATIESARRIIPPGLDAWTERYPTVSIPTLVIHGSEDRIVPMSVPTWLTTALPNGRLEVLRGCGHIPPEERPRESLELVLSFLRDG